MWFTETAWPPILICSVVAALFFVGWQAQRRRIHVWGVGAMIALSLLIYYFELSYVTELERVEIKVHELAAAVAELDVDKSLALVSVNAFDVQGRVKYGLQLLESVENMRVTDVRITLAANDSRATTHFRANADVALFGGVQHQATRWLLTWQREANEWKIIKAQRLHIITGRPIQTLGGDG